VTTSDGPPAGGADPGHRTVDVIVVGGGPSGAAASYWLAWHGHDVVLLERHHSPRPKTCGDALTPRAVHQLREMGLSSAAIGGHRTRGVRAVGPKHRVEVPWPDHPLYPDHGLVLPRRALDAAVLQHAQRRGVTVLEGVEAMQPVVERGFVRGVVAVADDDRTMTLSCRYLVVADGANSRFGRSLGTFRTREWPYATAIRSYWATPRHDDVWLETSLTLTDRNDVMLPGYGWTFPMGDGNANIGVGLLSTFRDFKGVNTSHLLESFVHQIADSWHLEPDEARERPTSGRIPLGASVGPHAGPSYLVIGDAAGMVSPLNGAGVEYAYESGRLAAHVLHEALADDSPAALQRFPKLLDDAYGDYFKVARLCARFMGKPALMRRLAETGTHSRSLMEWLLRMSSNMLRDDEVGPAEVAFKSAALLARLAPNT
jgi:menaquinone-9 beta-reductase